MVCLESVELEQYLSGELNDLASQMVRDHVGLCHACRRMLEDISANLQLVAPIRSAVANNAAMSWERPPAAIDGFQIIAELGRGGMGIVYLAQQNYPQRRVALKIIRPELAGGQLRRRFEREANALAKLRHPGIARVLQAGVTTVHGPAGREEVPYVAMEFIDGERLDRFARQRQLDLRERLAMVALIAEAVHHAHLHGLVHRDLKPANILIVDEADSDRNGTQGPRAQPKILDFGVARFIDEERPTFCETANTEPGRIIGTVPYMSPEQIASSDDEPIDARSDVYSLGVIAFELLTDQLPIDATTCGLLEAARRIREDQPRRAGAINVALRGDVETMLGKALARESAQRYDSAASFASDIRRFLNDEPIAARPAGAIEQLARLARRHRAGAAAASLIVVTLIAAAIVSAWQAHRAGAAQDEAERRLTEAIQRNDRLMNDLSARLTLIPGTDELRFELAKDVNAYFEQLAIQYPARLEVRQGLWESLRLLASFASRRGDRDEAEALIRRSHAMVLQAAEEHADDPQIRFQHAYSLRHLATTQKGLDEVARTKLLGQSIDILSQLVEQSPADALFHRELAASLHYLSHAQRATNLAAARESMRQSVEQLGAAVDLTPERTWDRLRLAGAQAHAGVLAQEAEDRLEAIEAFRAAIHTTESFDWTGFDRVRARDQLLSAHRLCVAALEASGRLDDAYD